MKTLVSVLSLAALLGSVAPAQTIKHTLPRGLEAVDGGNYSFGNWSFQNGNNSRWQFTYKWTEFVHQCPITITQIAFRPNVDVNMIGGTYQNVVVTLASATAPHNALSGLFANNLETDAQVVFMGDVVIPAYTATGADPAPFVVTIPFNTGFFEYDASKLKDIVIDIQTLGGTAAGSEFSADGLFPSAVNSQLGHITDPNSPNTNWVNFDAGPVVEVCYLLGASSLFDVTATTSGGGVGDLFLQINNVPTGTIRGFTLISRFPWSGELGTGPVFGLNPDITLFSILTLPAAPGSPLHWTFPSTGFPGSALSFPAGTMAPFTGEVWQTAAVGIGPAGEETGHTAVKEIVF